MTETIVSAEWLSQQLNNPQVVIIDCRFALSDPDLGRKQYEEGHIPGAYYLDLNQDLSSPVQQHGGRHPLPNPNDLAQKLSEMGITGATRIVAYDDSRFAFASRLWWLLRYLGHSHVSILDGGWTNWFKQGYPVNSEIPASSPGNFLPHLQSDGVVSYEQVQAQKDLPNVVLVDSRERDRYLGKHEPIDPIAGHIPGAVNYPWQEVTNENGFLQDIQKQQQRWEELGEEKEVIVYCGSGVTACVNLLSLELAGVTTGKLYAGSWSDWCSYVD